MRFADLQPEWLRFERRDSHVYHLTVQTMAEAQGVMFLCPKCFAANGGARGTHQVICWSEERGAPLEATPAPGRWALRGTGFDDLTLDSDRGRARSILLGAAGGGGCNWHGYVTRGEVTDA